LEEKLRIIGINPANLTVNNISRTVSVYAPISGYVSKVNVNIGKYVNPTDVLFELINPDDIHAAMTVFEKDISLFKQGTKGKVALLDKPEEQYDVEVLLITKNIDESRSGLIHCHFENPPRHLLPGMFLSGSFESTNKNVLALPEEAIVRYLGKQYIFTTQDEETFTLTPVEIGTTDAGFVAVSSADNQNLPNQKIVIKGAFALLGKLKNKGEDE
jgi:cobalt-zinc-cadmium efflux system membrane fusion protein